MLHRVRSLVAVIVLGLPGVAAAQPGSRRPPPRPPATSPMSTFLQQDTYTYCDVKVLAARWQQSIGEAKVTTGRKLQRNDTAALDAQLATARVAARRNPRARCSFSEAGFSYADAVALGKAWNQSTAEVKALVEVKILDGAEHHVRALARSAAVAPPPAPAPAPIATFLQQEAYTYCDAKLLGGLWRTSVASAKATIGAKLQAGSEAELDRQLGIARKRTRVRCSYADAGFSFADVEALATLWKLPLRKAKALVEKKARAGHTGNMRAQLPTANPDAASLTAFLDQDKYTYCDAKLLSVMWKQSIEQAKVLIGSKVTSNGGRGLDRVLAAVRTEAQQTPAAHCSFHEAGYTYQDAQALGRLWKQSPSRAKAFAETKIMHGDEATLRAELRRATRPVIRHPQRP